ncbi:MFS transporter [Burkholderia seminalis]|uniref:MFS transporter n=2 Tax=Burkholderia cepacia complex TaxID=87882 RepID=A0A8A8DIN7_9BURK|nr:MFS transporter [Burkholderia seminalis]
MVLLLSLGGFFEYYDIFFMGYVAPGMVESGMFTPASLGIFAKLKPIAVAGFGTFVFATFMGLWISTFVFGSIADRFGRRKVFTFSLIWYTVCSVIMAFQTSGASLVSWRFLAGIGIGMELVTIDSYISEIVPSRDRGKAFALNMFISFLAMPLVAYLAYALKGTHPLGLDYWRFLVLLSAVGAVAVWFIRRGLPESPRWLIQHRRVEEADRIVTAIENKVVADTRRPLAEAIERAAEVSGKASWSEIFKPPLLGRTITMSVFNIAPVIGFYGFAAWVPTLLIHRGIHVSSSLQYAFFIAIANPIGPLLGMTIADRVERKVQIAGGLTVMGMIIGLFSVVSTPWLLITLGVCFTLAANIMAYAFHGYQAELFPTRVRARAIGFVYSWSRVAAAFTGLLMGIVLANYGVRGVAILISSFMIVGVIVILLNPSTNNKALEQISNDEAPAHGDVPVSAHCTIGKTSATQKR